MNNRILTNKILHWYDNNKRSLPWRGSYSQKKREYYTLISEFMLQQTQVSTVIPYFNNFLKKNNIFGEIIAEVQNDTFEIEKTFSFNIQEFCNYNNQWYYKYNAIGKKQT